MPDEDELEDEPDEELLEDELDPDEDPVPLMVAGASGAAANGDEGDGLVVGLGPREIVPELS